MNRFEHYGWPFFEEKHRDLAKQAEAWCVKNDFEEEDADTACRTFVRELGKAGFLNHCVSAKPDVRSIALLREIFAYHHGLADFAFVMQGLGSGPIVLAGTDAQKKAWLPRVAKGEAIAAFALSEPEAGSDVAAMNCSANQKNGGWAVNGVKTWISNGGIADFYVTFAKADQGISAFIVDARDVDASERIDIIAPHPMATVKFKDAKAD